MPFHCSGAFVELCVFRVDFCEIRAIKISYSYSFNIWVAELQGPNWIIEDQFNRQSDDRRGEIAC